MDLSWEDMGPLPLTNFATANAAQLTQQAPQPSPPISRFVKVDCLSEKK